MSPLRMYGLLQGKQIEIVDSILRAANDSNYVETKCFFIDGPGGTGKTFVYKTINSWPKSQSKMYGIYWNRINSIACWTNITQDIWSESSAVVRFNFQH